VGTGGRDSAGTDATVSLTLCTGSSCFLHVPNLAQYGTQGPSHDYFEKGNRDLFQIPTNEGCNYACRMIIDHDNSGNKPGWYLDFVYTGAYENNGVKRFESDFTVSRWLATSEWPYNTEAEVNHCPVQLQTNAHLPFSLLEQYVNA